MRLAVLAQEADLSIPKNLSYFCISQLNAQLYRTHDASLIDIASKHDDSNDSYTEDKKYFEIIVRIIHGHSKGTTALEEAGVIRNIDGNMDSFLSGGGAKKYALSPEDYGYLISINKKKLTVSDAKLFFELHFHRSPSNISKLFTKYRLSTSIRGYSRL